ncbi:PhoH family protein [Arthrobacter sp. Helios]|uniref:PhoH family protein n=1 Tax=Arthrobacter sp. Helios TaxID=2828862 RepID=UPI002063FA86|nr:PhoH family protein [Arthrobacter sp. Helios]UPO77568.1 PhoH family protein [Arthrobacter sp. Helios]
MAVSKTSSPAHAGTQAQPLGFVLDTSVLLSDPKAILRFAEHEVILPLVVISELESKRSDPELGYFARAALRLLDDLRVEHGGLDRPVPIGEAGGTLRVEVNHISLDVLPMGIRGTDNDSRILAVARSLADEGRRITVVSKDLPLRVKAAAVGLTADEYRNELVRDTGWTGMVELEVGDAEVNALYDHEPVFLPEAAELPVNTGLVLLAGRSSALGRLGADKQVRLVRGDRDVFGLHGRSAEQRLAIDLLMDPEVGIVSLGGRAGTGKSALALCAGLEAVLERREHRKVVVFRPLYAVGGQELGYLPGSEAEKMGPWGQAVFDTLEALVSREVVEEVLDRGMLEVLPLTHIRGRSLHDSFVIVDEAQSLEKNVLLTVLSRIGQNSKVVLTHDVAQRDNLRVGRHDGIAAVVETLKGHPLFGHMTLTRSERSPIAALVTELLEDGQIA